MTQTISKYSHFNTKLLVSTKWLLRQGKGTESSIVA